MNHETESRSSNLVIFLNIQLIYNFRYLALILRLEHGLGCDFEKWKFLSISRSNSYTTCGSNVVHHHHGDQGGSGASD